LEGKFDIYGFTIVEDTVEKVMTDEGIYTNEGSKTFLANKAEALKDDPKI
jgi:hypothetical protein